MEANEGIEGRLCEKVAWRKTGMGGRGKREHWTGHQAAILF